MVVFILTLAVAGGLFAQVKKGDTAWVASKTVDLKSSTWFFAGTNGTLQMGDRVTVLQIDGTWAQVSSVSNSSLSGWTSVSNLSARQIVASTSSASASEVALAGKGFNQEVENAYKADGDLNYADVDKTEAITVAPADIYNFIVEGHLNTGEKK